MTEILSELLAAMDVFAQEVEALIGFHEAWRPMVESNELHERIGNSRATFTFEFIRLALRREVLLGLVRLWDTQCRALSLEKVGEYLSDNEVVAALLYELTNRLPQSDGEHIVGASAGQVHRFVADKFIREEMAAARQIVINEALSLIRKYQQGGEGFALRKSLTKIRNEYLAHRQVRPSQNGQSLSDQAIEDFYQDMLRLAEVMYHAAKHTSYSLKETAQLRAMQSSFFWRGVKGERTEGHPDFKGLRIKSV